MLWLLSSIDSRLNTPLVCSLGFRPLLFVRRRHAPGNLTGVSIRYLKVLNKNKTHKLSRWMRNGTQSTSYAYRLWSKCRNNEKNVCTLYLAIVHWTLCIYLFHVQQKCKLDTVPCGTCSLENFDYNTLDTKRSMAKRATLKAIMSKNSWASTKASNIYTAKNKK